MFKNKGFTLIELIVVMAIISTSAVVFMDFANRVQPEEPTDTVDLNTTEQIEINGVLHNCDALDCIPVDK